MNLWEQALALLRDSALTAIIALVGLVYAILIKAFPQIEKNSSLLARRSVFVIAILITLGATFYLGTKWNNISQANRSGALVASANQQSTDVEEQNKLLQTKNTSLQNKVGALEKENQTLQQQLANIKVTDPVLPPDLPPADSVLVQQDDSTIYTVIETSNSGGTITVSLTALNEGEETDKCLYGPSVQIFDSQGDDRNASQVIVNENSENVSSISCGGYALPTGITRNIAIVFSGVSPDEGLIQEMRILDMRFRNIPVPYKG